MVNNENFKFVNFKINHIKIPLNLMYICLKYLIIKQAFYTYITKQYTIIYMLSNIF